MSCSPESFLRIRSEYKRRLKAKEKEVKDAAKAAEKVRCESRSSLSPSPRPILTPSLIGTGGQGSGEDCQEGWRSRGGGGARPDGAAAGRRK